MAAKRPRQPILLLSTDPAHSLGGILQTKLGDKPRRLRAAGRLWVWQLDADKQINSFLKTEREEILFHLSICITVPKTSVCGTRITAHLTCSLPMHCGAPRVRGFRNACAR